MEVLCTAAAADAADQVMSVMTWRMVAEKDHRTNAVKTMVLVFSCF